MSAEDSLLSLITEKTEETGNLAPYPFASGQPSPPQSLSPPLPTVPPPEEVSLYNYGLLNTPRLIARSSTSPWRLCGGPLGLPIRKEFRQVSNERFWQLLRDKDHRGNYQYLYSELPVREGNRRVAGAPSLPEPETKEGQDTDKMNQGEMQAKEQDGDAGGGVGPTSADKKDLQSDNSFVKQLVDTMREMEIDWLFIQKIRIGRVGDVDALPTLWIGVNPSSISSEKGVQLAIKCKKLLLEHGITDVECEIVEWSLRARTHPDSIFNTRHRNW